MRRKKNGFGKVWLLRMGWIFAGRDVGGVEMMFELKGGVAEMG